MGKLQDISSLLLISLFAEMEAMMVPDVEGQPTMSTTEIVDKVLSQSSATSKFLKNVGLNSSTPNSAKDSKQQALEEQLEEERRGAAELRQTVEQQQQEVQDLKLNAQASDEALIKTQKEMEDLKKRQEENDAIIRRLMRMAGEDN